MKNRSGGGRNEETAYDTAVNCEATKEGRGGGKLDRRKRIKRFEMNFTGRLRFRRDSRVSFAPIPVFLGLSPAWLVCSIESHHKGVRSTR